jgi:hypothetical protein
MDERRNDLSIATERLLPRAVRRPLAVCLLAAVAVVSCSVFRGAESRRAELRADSTVTVSADRVLGRFDNPAWYGNQNGPTSPLGPRDLRALDALDVHVARVWALPRGYYNATGVRCRNVQVTGLQVCRMHGGSSPQARRKVASARAAKLLGKEFARGAVPVADDDPEVTDGGIALRREIARTLSWIRFCERKIDELGSDEAMVFGLSMTEDKTVLGAGHGGNTSYKLRRDEAKPIPWIDVLNLNRAHLARLIDIWVRSGLELRKITFEAQFLDRMEATIDGIVSDLGINPNSPETRKIIFKHLSGLSS